MSLAVVQPLARPRQTAQDGRGTTRSIPQPFTLAHFRRWASDLILDTGDPWRLEPFQEAFIADLFSGFRECWLIVPEGNTKTTTLAGLALYHAEHRSFAAVPVAAASREQAEIMYRQAEGFVLRSEALHAPVRSLVQVAKGKRKTDVPRFVCLEGYRRINHHAGGRIQVFAADDRTGDGVIPTLGIIDEPHRQRDLSLYRTWAGKLEKRDGQIAAISTRGEPGSDFELTLQRIREAAEVIEQDGPHMRAVAKRIVLHEWALPKDASPDDFVAVKAANPFSGITVEALREKHDSATMTAHHWLRFVCNRPTVDVDTWLGPDAVAIWHGLEEPWALIEAAPTWVGVDIGWKHDSSAVVAIQQRMDGERIRWHAVARIWAPRPNLPVDITDVMQHLRDLDRAYSLEAVSFDPRFFDVPAKMLADEGLPMIEVPQSPERMTPAVGGAYEAIMGGLITHDADEAFTAHVLNAAPRFNERGFTLAKGKSQGRIDAAVALALAYDRVQRQPVVEEPEPFMLMGAR